MRKHLSTLLCGSCARCIPVLRTPAQRRSRVHVVPIVSAGGNLGWHGVNALFFVGVGPPTARYSDVVGSVKALVDDSHRFVGTAPVSQP